MKKYIFLIFFCVAATDLLAMPGADSIPTHLRQVLLPDFKILLPDGKTNFYAENLSKNKQTIIINFSPECEHCRLQTEELIKHIDQFRGTQIVMATSLPFEKMKQFYDELQIRKYKSIIMGRDVLFFFSRYYRNQYLPGIAVYNKKRALLNFYDGGAKTEELIKLVNE
jgi:hypothetical protein